VNGRVAVAGVAVLVAVALLVWTPSEPRTTAAPPDGAQLFTAKGCASCHMGPDSTTRPVVDFPSLIDAGGWAGERIEGVAARDYLVQSIAAPSAFTAPGFDGGFGPAGGMPDLLLTSEEIDALVDYLLAD